MPLIANSNLLFKRLRQLASVRDGILVIIGCAYILGYFAWGIHSWRINLGPAPALDSQYFISGLPIFAICYLGIKAARSSVYFSRSFWPNWLKTKGKRTIGTIYRIIIILVFTSVILTIVASTKIIRVPPAFPFFVLILLYFLLIFFNPFLEVLNPINSSINTNQTASIKGLQQYLFKLTTFSHGFSLYFIPLLTAFMLSAIYIAVIYPKIPQVLGGGAPRSAQIQVISDRFNPEWLSEFSLKPLQNPLPKIIQSRTVYIYSNQKDYIIITLEINHKNKPGSLHEIRQDSIVSIKWL